MLSRFRFSNAIAEEGLGAGDGANGVRHVLLLERVSSRRQIRR
jgi:hypothetical protein